MLWFILTCRKATAGSLKMPRKSVIFIRCSPLSCVSFSKWRPKFSEYQEATSAGVFTLSGNPAAVGNSALIVVSRKRISAAAMWRGQFHAGFGDGWGGKNGLFGGAPIAG